MISLVFFKKKVRDQVLESNMTPEIKKELEQARKYAAGRGIRIEVNEKNIPDIKKLVEIKLAN